MNVALSPAEHLRKAPAIWLWWGAAAVCFLWARAIDQWRVEWTINAQYAYGWGVPFLACYLFWKRWQDRPAVPSIASEPRRLGCRLLFGAACFLFLPVRLIEVANPDWRLVSWAYLFLGLLATLSFLAMRGGLRWAAHFTAPLVLLATAVPWPTPLEQRLTQGLMRAVAGITVELLHWGGIPAAQQGNVLILANGPLGINQACSGVRSFQATLMAAVFLGELWRLQIGRRLWLIVIGTLAAFSFNVVRTFFLAWTNAAGGAGALLAWHDPAGYVVLGLTLIVLFGTAHLLQRRNAKADRSRTINAGDAACSFANPLSARRWTLYFAGWLVLAEVATMAWYRSHERNYVRQPAWEIAWPAEAGWVFQPIPEEIQLVLRFNEGKFAHAKAEAGQWWVYAFRWAPGRASAQLARNHTPTICLPASGLQLEADLGAGVLRIGALDLPYRKYVFERGPEKFYAFFCLWEERLPRVQAAGAVEDMSRRSRLQAVVEGRRHLGQQVVEVVIESRESADGAEKQFQRMLQKMIHARPAVDKT